MASSCDLRKSQEVKHKKNGSKKKPLVIDENESMIELSSHKPASVNSAVDLRRSDEPTTLKKGAGLVSKGSEEKSVAIMGS